MPHKVNNIDNFLIISFYYQNVQGLRTFCSQFLQNSFNTSHDIIMLTETWLVLSISNSELFTSDFSVYRREGEVVFGCCQEQP